MVGDRVEFTSDRHTEKGPSSGICIFADSNRVAIRHSDTVEWFRFRDLFVERETRTPDGRRLWILK